MTYYKTARDGFRQELAGYIDLYKDDTESWTLHAILYHLSLWERSRADGRQGYTDAMHAIGILAASVIRSEQEALAKWDHQP